MDTLSVLLNSNAERIHSVIVDVFDVILEGWTLIPPHALSHIEL